MTPRLVDVVGAVLDPVRWFGAHEARERSARWVRDGAYYRFDTSAAPRWWRG